MCASAPVDDSVQVGSNLVVDGGDLYFLSGSGVARMSKQGGGAKLVASSGGSKFAVHAGTVHYSAKSGSKDAIWSVSSDGTPKLLVDGIMGGVAEIAASATHVYFFSSDCALVRRVSVAGGMWEALSQTSCNSFGQTQFAANPARTTAFTNFLSAGTSHLRRVDLLKGGATPIVDAVQPLALAANADRVVWINPGTCEGGLVDGACKNGDVSSASYSGGLKKKLIDLATIQPASGYRRFGASVALDDSHVYFWAQAKAAEPRSIWRAPLSGGSPLKLQVVSAAGDHRLVVDEQHVYYVDGSQHVRRLAK
jgi:hypothetical protein